MWRWLIPLVLLASPAAAARITGLSMSPGEVTIVADGPPTTVHQLALVAPYRLVIDLPAALDAPLTAAGAGTVIRLRAAMFVPGTARLVLDLSRPLAIVAARSSATGLTVTLKRITPEAFAEDVRVGRRPLSMIADGAVASRATPFQLPGDAFRPAPAPVEPLPVTDKPDVVPQPSGQPPARAGIRARSGGKPLVVIDAGHGGKDVGAISVGGGYEKDVTLAIARATQKRLQRSGRVRVVLTRNDDRFIPLGGRATIARNASADLFISIHADAAGNPEARGASVYTLSAIASDAVAARLAARENKADIIGGVNLGMEAPDVGDIMIDLSRRATGNVSVAFAEVLQDTLSDRIRFRGEFHHFAGFRVLKAPDVPSVLLETGYVTNRTDAELLFSDAGRRRIAEGIARAVERHLVGD